MADECKFWILLASGIQSEDVDNSVLSAYYSISYVMGRISHELRLINDIYLEGPSVWAEDMLPH